MVQNRSRRVSSPEAASQSNFQVSETSPSPFSSLPRSRFFAFYSRPKKVSKLLASNCGRHRIDYKDGQSLPPPWLFLSLILWDVCTPTTSVGISEPFLSALLVWVVVENGFAISFLLVFSMRLHSTSMIRTILPLSFPRPP